MPGSISPTLCGEARCSCFLAFYKEKLRDFLLHRTLPVLNYSVGSTTQSKTPGLKGVHIFKVTSKSAHSPHHCQKGMLSFLLIWWFFICMLLSVRTGFPLWLSWWRIRLRCGRPAFDPWVGKIPWRREKLPTPVSWLGEFHRLYRPWGRKESDTNERLSNVLTGAIFCGLCY